MDGADDAVVAEIEKLPCGKFLKQHIHNIRTGRTKKDAIDADLVPYDGMMNGPAASDADDVELDGLKSALESFRPDAQHLEKIKSLSVVRRFGDRWHAGIRALLDGTPHAAMWTDVVRADSAIRLWARAAEILSSAPSELLRAEVQADMPEYETYMPLFGKDGNEILSRLRKFIVE